MKVNNFISIAAWACLPSIIAAQKCNADNCARAATGTLGGSQAARLSACSSFQRCTATPAITTTIINCPTSTPAAVAPSCTPSGALTSRYASACSCAGITRSTSTATIAPPVALQTNFALVSGKGPDARFIDVVFPNPDDPGMTDRNYGSVLQLQPAGVVPSQRFRLGGPGDELKTADDIARAAFFFNISPDVYDANSIAISSVYMNIPGVDQDFSGYEFAPLSCSFGAYDLTVPGYPLNCNSPTQGLSKYYKTDNSVLSLGLATEKTQRPVAQLYAVYLPAISASPKGIPGLKRSKMAPQF